MKIMIGFIVFVALAFIIGQSCENNKEPYLTQEEFEEFHHTIMDGLNIPRQMLKKLLKY